MIRGTTPTLHYFTALDTSTLDLTRTFITLKCGNTTLEFTGARIIAGVGKLSVKLTQQETLSLGENKVIMQIRGVLTDGITAVATNAMMTTVEGILKDGEI